MRKPVIESLGSVAGIALALGVGARVLTRSARVTRGLAVVLAVLGVSLVHASSASAQLAEPVAMTLSPVFATNPVGTQHTVSASVMCVTESNPVPAPCPAGVFVEFTVSGANSARGSALTDSTGRAAFRYVGRTVGFDTIRAVARGASATASKTWTSGPPDRITLSPADAVNTVGDPHTVTATVEDFFGNPVPGAQVDFEVSLGGSPAPSSGLDITDDNGQATFTYTNTEPVTDAITASVRDCCRAEARKQWVVGPPARLTLSPKTAVNPVGSQHCVTATVTDRFGNPPDAVFVRFSITGAVNTSGSTSTNASGQAEFCYSGPPTPGRDAIHAYADTNNSNTQDAGEPFDDAAKTWGGPGSPATLTLSPKTAVNPVGSRHCVTATVADAVGTPTAGVTVRFSVTGSVNTSGSPSTNASGQAEFCYSGPPLPGTDAIHAYADANNSNTQDPGEPFDDAAKTWVLPASTPGCEVNITNGGWIIAANGDRSSLGGNAKVDAAGNVSGNEQYQDHGPAQPMNFKGNVLVVMCTSPTQATIYGQATIDGSGSFLYRLNVEDNAEPGTGADKYWLLVDNGYNSGNQPLMGGDVQIHKG